MPGVPGVAVEVKAERALNLAAALAEAQVEAGNAGVCHYLAVLKRRRRPVPDWYAVMICGWPSSCSARTGGEQGPSVRHLVDELVNVRLRETAPGCTGSTMTRAATTTGCSRWRWWRIGWRSGRRAGKVRRAGGGADTDCPVDALGGPEHRPFLPLPRCNAAGQASQVGSPADYSVASLCWSSAGLQGRLLRSRTPTMDPRQLVPVLLPAHLLDQQRPGSAALHRTVVRHRRQPFQSQRATLATEPASASRTRPGARRRAMAAQISAATTPAGPR